MVLKYIKEGAEMISPFVPGGLLINGYKAAIGMNHSKKSSLALGLITEAVRDLSMAEYYLFFHNNPESLITPETLLLYGITSVGSLGLQYLGLGFMEKNLEACKECIIDPEFLL